MNRRRRPQATIPAGALIELPEEAARQFDQLQRLESRLRRIERLKRKTRRLRKDLSSTFQGAGLGRLPDGRLVGRFRQRRDWPALPAKTVEWDEFQELPPFDADD